MSAASTWSDLRTRVLSGVVMAAAGLAAVWAGGLWLQALAIVAGGLMIWELAAMLMPGNARRARFLGMAGAVLLALVIGVAQVWMLPLLLLPAAAAPVLPKGNRKIFAAYGSAILVATFGVVYMRETLGLPFLGWVLLVVIVTDILGYFGGRLIGGPKFWPRVSPKKTWSGTISGWAGAAAIGAGFVQWAGIEPAIVPVSVCLSFASQMGDIVESAIKRRAGIKDSSTLIPGHGGLLDRFDGLIGASLLVVAFSAVFSVQVLGG